MREHLIDVSEWNGKIDWKKVKESGINYAILRIGGRYGKSGFLYSDDRFLENIKACNELNIKVGVYFFTQAIYLEEAEDEAEWTLEQVKDYKIDLPIYIDSEYLEDGRHNDLDAEERTYIIEAFCKRIKAGGYKPGLYASLNWLQTEIDYSYLKNISLWIAQYNYECECPYPYDIWQYTSSGDVDGVKGDCDKNLIYNIPEDDIISDDIKVKAVDVLLGKYGNGEERKRKLGNDYDKVQKLVNELYERMENHD